MLSSTSFKAFCAELEKIAADEPAGTAPSSPRRIPTSFPVTRSDTAGTRFMEGVKAPFAESANLLRPTRAASTLKNIWQGSSNMSDLNRKALSDEVRDANKGLSGGRYVNDLKKSKGVTGTLRQQGWLANFGKYEGPSKFRQVRNVVARHLPGQRTLLVGGTGMQAMSDAAKHDESGRERGAGERIVGTLGGTVGSLGSLSPRAMHSLNLGKAGLAGGLVGSLAAGMVGSAGGKFVGRKIDEARGFKPSAPPGQGTG
jgi:hypothetical protein